ncbi:MAG TPA: hypothetical protein ENN19_01165 [Chloroflexi bacterium]|nr:hypothetical protein [Chloroflexota bacterium]
MNIKKQHFLGTTSILLVLAILLSGLALSVAAMGIYELSPKLVMQGTGDFPRLPVVAPGTDGATLALYLVEGDTATQLMTLEGTRAGSNRADARLSPDGRYVACLRTEGEHMRPVLEVVDTQKAQRVIIAEGPKDVREKGAAWEELASVAWMDAEHILYSKVMWPSSEEWVAGWEKGTPPPVQGEVWMSSVDGKE